MKRYILNKPFTKIITKSKEESGILFPYALTIMLVVSSFILLSWQNEKDQLKHIQLLNDQETIQNLIQIALHEFSYTLDTLEPSDVKQSLKFDYMTGSVDISYNLSSQSKLRLELIVKLADHEEPSYTHVTHWNV